MTTDEIIAENIESIGEWALAAISEREMAEMLGMGYSTFRKMKKNNLILRGILEEAKSKRNEVLNGQVKNVEESLYKRCLGYNAKVMKNYKVKKVVLDAKGAVIFDKGGKAVTEETLEERTEETHVPADITAVKFFLLNRARKQWSNDPERIEIDRKRLANDTKRTEIAQTMNAPQGARRSIEDFLDEAEDGI